MSDESTAQIEKAEATPDAATTKRAASGCCALDAQVKSAGGSGCGCATAKPAKSSGCC